MKIPRWTVRGQQRRLRLGRIELARSDGGKGNQWLDICLPGRTVLVGTLHRDPASAVRIAEQNRCKPKSLHTCRTLVNTERAFVGVYNGGPNLLEVGLGRRMVIVVLLADDLRSWEWRRRGLERAGRDAPEAVVTDLP